MWGRVIGLGLMLVMEVRFPIGLGMMLVKNIGSEDRPDFMGIIPKA